MILNPAQYAAFLDALIATHLPWWKPGSARRWPTLAQAILGQLEA